MKNKFLKVSFILMSSLTLGIGFGQGCSKPFTPSNGDVNQSSVEDSNTSNNIDPTVPTLAMVYNKQVLDHLVSCSGIGLASDETLQTWSAKRGAVSIDGTVLTITAPMLMAVTTISGDVCRDLINLEKSSPRIFNNINWSGNTLPSDSVLSDSIRGLALSCWQRPEEELEHQIILDGLKSEFATGTVDVSDAFLYLCTSMLSSVDTLTL